VQNFPDSLQSLLSLNPVTYHYNGLAETPKDTSSTAPRLGYIAQQVQRSAPQFVSTTSASLHEGDTATTDLLQVNYTAIQFAVVNAIKEIGNMTGTFKAKLVEFLQTWLGSSDNGLAKVQATQLQTDMLCVKKANGTSFCANGDQLAAIAATSGVAGTPPPVPPVTPPATTPPADLAPVVTVTVGTDSVTAATPSTWVDSGATVVDDHDTGLVAAPTAKDSVTNAPVDMLTLGTVAGTYTVTYTATDSTGHTGTAARTVTVQ
jgi:Domain of unknown function (DUF5011)/Chaperone of endosialidase